MKFVLAIAAISANLQLAGAWAGQSCCKGYHESSDLRQCKITGTPPGATSSDFNVPSKRRLDTVGKAWWTIKNGPNGNLINDQCCLLFCCHKSPGFENHITVSCPFTNVWLHFNCDDGAFQPFRNVDTRRLPEPELELEAPVIEPQPDRRRFSSSFFAAIIEQLTGDINKAKCVAGGHKDVWNPTKRDVKPINIPGSDDLQELIDEHSVPGQAKKVVRDLARDGVIIGSGGGASGAIEAAGSALSKLFGRRRAPDAQAKRHDNTVE